MPTADRKLRVFLCHSSQDKPIVRELYQRLTVLGIVPSIFAWFERQSCQR
jgi:hypothetical protein